MAAGLLIVAAVVLWILLAWGWGLVIHGDESVFFDRLDAPIWNPAAVAWLAVAVLLPTSLIVALALFRSDFSIVVADVVLVVVGLALAVLLNSSGRRFGDPRETNG